MNNMQRSVSNKGNAQAIKSQRSKHGSGLSHSVSSYFAIVKDLNVKFSRMCPHAEKEVKKYLPLTSCLAAITHKIQIKHYSLEDSLWPRYLKQRMNLIQGDQISISVHNQGELIIKAQLMTKRSRIASCSQPFHLLPWLAIIEYQASKLATLTCCKIERTNQEEEEVLQLDLQMLHSLVPQ
jgi:hypothetical protein